MEFSPRTFLEPLSLSRAHIVSFSLDVGQAEYERLNATLAKDELARADRFLLPEIRKRFVVCRGRTRTLLAQLTGQSAAEIQFEYEQWGKPRLRTGRTSPLQFNVSHSGDWALLAVAASPVGIDLEVQQARFRYRSIASQVISPQEQAAWNAVPARDRDAAMMRLWVCKEALLKAMGLGIAEGLQQIAFPLPIPESQVFEPTAIASALQLHIEDDGSCRTNNWIDPSSWRMQLLQAIPGTYAAIAVPRTIRQLEHTRYSEAIA